LFEERLRRVKLKGQSRFVNGHGRGFLIHLLALEISLERVQKEPIVRHAVPIKDLLLLLSANAVVLIQEVQEGAFGFLERSVSSRFEIAKI